jgi:hypothetical protein
MPHSVVAFADALGTSVSSSYEETASTFLTRLQKATASVAQRINKIGPLYDIHVRWFSDSIAMSVSFGDPRQLAGLLANLAFIQAGYALNGIFLRGAVTTGRHHHSEYIDFGPALTEAVHLENHAGDGTRIVLSPRLHDDLQAFGMGQLPIAEDLEDATYFLDFIGALDTLMRLDLRSQIQTSYQESMRSGDSRTLQKLGWLASYYNWRTRPARPLEYATIREFREFRPGGRSR